MSQGPICKHIPPLSAYVDSHLVQLRCEPNNISRPVEICPDARAQLFTACMCYNSKENAIKKSINNGRRIWRQFEYGTDKHVTCMSTCISAQAVVTSTTRICTCSGRVCTVNCNPFYWHGLSVIPVITCPFKCGVKLFIHPKLQRYSLRIDKWCHSTIYKTILWKKIPVSARLSKSLVFTR